MLPSKIINIKKSVLWKLPEISNSIKLNSNIKDAYYSVEMEIEDINEFLFCIDILFLLDMIELYDEKGNYKYVKRN